MKKLWMIVMMGIFLMSLISFTSALDSLGTFEQNECVEIKQACATCSFVNISMINFPDSSIALSNVEMNNVGNGGWNYTFCNNSFIGRYDIIGKGDKDGVDTSFAMFYKITMDGSELSIFDIIARFFLIGFLILFFMGTYFVIERTDFKKWNDGIIKKYHTKNFIKMVLSALTYNLMKNSYIIYYLIGLPIVMLATSITSIYNIEGLVTFMNVFLFIYTIGIPIVGIVFLSYVQEWIMNMIELIKDIDWGIN